MRSTPTSPWRSASLTLTLTLTLGALYPNLAVAERQHARHGKGGKGGSYEQLTVGGEQAWFHPSSVNSSPERAEPGLFVFVDKVTP